MAVSSKRILAYTRLITATLQVSVYARPYLQAENPAVYVLSNNQPLDCQRSRTPRRLCCVFVHILTSHGAHSTARDRIYTRVKSCSYS